MEITYHEGLHIESKKIYFVKGFDVFELEWESLHTINKEALNILVYYRFGTTGYNNLLLSKYESNSCFIQWWNERAYAESAEHKKRCVDHIGLHMIH